MSIEVITKLYTAMLIAKALSLSLVTARCSYAIYRNHLEKRVRILLFGTAALTATAAIESWVRSWGRVHQWMCGIEPTQANPELALAAIVLANMGLVAWITTMETTTHLGIRTSTGENGDEND